MLVVAQHSLYLELMELKKDHYVHVDIISLCWRQVQIAITSERRQKTLPWL